MQTMYPGIVNSPITEISSAITASQTSITLLNGAALPAAPNIAVIGQGDNAETILYTSKSGNTISGVTRGFQGTAQSWVIGTKVARNFTAYDYDAMRGNIDEKLDKADPYYGGTLASWDGASTGNTFAKYLGSKLTLSASPHQKMEIWFPINSFNGWIDISVTGNWGNTNASGNVTKRFAINLSPSGVINSQHSRYIEAIGSIASYVSIGDMFYDSASKMFLVKVSYRATATGGSESLAVKIEGMCITGLTMVRGTSITAFYANSEVYPLPVVTYLNQVAFNAPQGIAPISVNSTTEVPSLNVGRHHGWVRINSTVDLDLTASASLTTIISAMPANYAIACLYVDGANAAALGLTGKYGFITITKWGSTRIEVEFVDNGGLVKLINPVNLSGAPTGWKTLSMNDGTLQSNLNSERTNGIKMFNSLTTPVGGSNGDVWFPPSS